MSNESCAGRPLEGVEVGLRNPIDRSFLEFGSPGSEGTALSHLAGHVNATYGSPRVNPWCPVASPAYGQGTEHT